MNKFHIGAVTAAAFGAALAVAGATPASAQLARPQSAAIVAGDNVMTTEVQWRRGGGYYRGGGYRGGYRYGGYRGRGWYGPGIGFATGLAIGGAFAAPYYYGPPVYAAPPVYAVPQTNSAVAYCMQRFKSYDPASGTYLGYDGRRHPCP